MRVFRLRIERVERRTPYLVRSLGIAVKPFSVEGDALPSVVDGREDLIGFILSSHLEEHAPTIALRVYAVEFQETKAPRRESPLRVSQSDHAGFTGGHVREAAKEGGHVGKCHKF